MSSQIKEMRMQLTHTEIKNILGQYGVLPFDENETEIIFPTACHNLKGGSPKLYYYKNEKMFRCYTECNKMFDIFDLLMKMDKLRGIETNLSQAIRTTGVDNNKPVDVEIYKDIEFLRKVTQKTSYGQTELTVYDKDVLNRFSYDLKGLKSWIDEGITERAMKKFNILYDSFLNAIVIPNFDHAGDLIGIRGRFLNPDSPYKYLPLKSYNTTYSFPTGKVLYGLYQNQENIKKKKTIIIFEGEKSVLKADEYLKGNNISVATLGNKITLDHLNLLLSLEVNEVMLAYDKDFTNKKEREETMAEWDKLLTILKPYFKVTFLIDTDNQLDLKDSPIDKGKDVFMELIKYRVKR